MELQSYSSYISNNNSKIALKRDSLLLLQVLLSLTLFYRPFGRLSVMDQESDPVPGFMGATFFCIDPFTPLLSGFKIQPLTENCFWVAQMFFWGPERIYQRHMLLIKDIKCCSWDFSKPNGFTHYDHLSQLLFGINDRSAVFDTQNVF